MAETQMSMFGGDSEQLHALIDRLDDIPDDVLKKNWRGPCQNWLKSPAQNFSVRGLSRYWPVNWHARWLRLRQPIWADGVITCRSGNLSLPSCETMRYFRAGTGARKLNPFAAITGCQKPRFIPSYANSAVCIWQERNRHFSDIPQSLPPLLHRYADSENIMRQRNNAKTPRTTA